MNNELTPKDKAIKLRYKMFMKFPLSQVIGTTTTFGMLYAKDMALVAVEEIIASVPTMPSNTEMERIDAVTFWVQVHQELEKL
jgi:hypothetical protein